jgi:hypothetical protein
MDRKMEFFCHHHIFIQGSIGELCAEQLAVQLFATQNS